MRIPRTAHSRWLFIFSTLLAACATESPESRSPSPKDGKPSILLITLDTTRADSMGWESEEAHTPNLDALAARGQRFSQAYTTAPMTLPSHASMFTGLYPADHGIRENARYLADDKELLADRMRELGYQTAAFVSGLPLSSQFGLARGFDHYDDEIADEAAERLAGETTDRALTWLAGRGGEPLFLWVHYFDPHDPYDPPEPFRSEIDDPYLAEIASMDHEAGRLIEAFEGWAGDEELRILVVGDHGEGRGDHGEVLHGNLLYQGVMRVPLVIAGTGVASGEVMHPVSVRRIFDTVLDWAGEDRPHSLTGQIRETVLGEAMKPFLQYGWQPQVMALRDGVKVIHSGGLEIYDVVEDPGETRDLAAERQLDGELRRTLSDYLKRLEEDSADTGMNRVSQQDRERLASLGYVSWEGRTRIRDDAPRAKDMTSLFTELDRGSGLFIQGRYDEAIPVFEEIFEQDAHNLMVALRLAVANSVTGRDRNALDYFDRARTIDPESIDVRHYLGMHYLRRQAWDDAGALLTSVVAESPDRLPALEGLARVREAQGRIAEASDLLERVLDARSPSREELLKLGDMKMGIGDTLSATRAFEQARDLDDGGFPRFLELGVLYMADRRLEEARDSLDRVPASHPGYPMALFKRAQVAVLLGEPDSEESIRRAQDNADATTRRLIESESLFRGMTQRRRSGQ